MYKDFTAILTDMFKALNVANEEARKRGAQEITDLNIGSVVRTLLEADAALLEECWYALEVYTRNFFLRTSEGEWIDKRVADFGMVRKSGQRAAGVIAIGRKTPSPVGIFIPAGTPFVDENNREYLTSLACTLSIGGLSIDVATAAANVGSNGNLPAGYELKQAGVAITGIEFAKVVVMSGGVDAESDNDLVERVPVYLASLSDGTKTAIYAAAMSVSGVIGATIRENVPENGWFRVYVDDGTANPPKELLDAVRAAVELARAFTIHFEILAPKVQIIEIEASVVVKVGTNPESVRAACKEALIKYINALDMGQQVYIADLYFVIRGVDGVENAKVIKPTADTDYPDDVSLTASNSSVVVN